MNRTGFLGLGLAGVLAGSVAFGKAGSPVTVETRVVKATVYREGAQVVREGKKRLPEGESVLVIPELPVSADPNSLRVTLRGPKGSLMHNVQLRTVLGSVEVEKRTRDYRKRIRGYEDRKAVIQDRIAARNEELDMLRTRARGGRDPKGQAPDWKDLTQGAETVANRIHELLDLNRQDGLLVRDLDEKIGELQRAVALSGSLQRDTLALDVELETPIAGEVTFDVAYVVREASWRPAYDLALASESATSSLQVTLVGEVTQRTGEDWSDTRLTVSTERPAYLAAPVPAREDYRRTYRDRAPAALPMAAGGRMSAAREALAEDADVPVPYQGARTEAGEFATRYRVATPVSIKTGTDARRVALLDNTYACRAAVVIVPAVAPTAALEASVSYFGDQPLVAGPAQLYRDGEFVGTGNVGAVMPGEDLKVNFGMDPAIRITRKYPVKGKEEGWGGWGSVTRRYRWETTLKSGHASRWNVEVHEQIPQLDDPEVTITPGELSAGLLADDPEKPGLKRWTVELEPGKSRVLVFEYTVRQKKGTPVRVG